jgi:hypothetical protein
MGVTSKLLNKEKRRFKVLSLELKSLSFPTVFEPPSLLCLQALRKGFFLRKKKKKKKKSSSLYK